MKSASTTTNEKRDTVDFSYLWSALVRGRFFLCVFWKPKVEELDDFIRVYVVAEIGVVDHGSHLIVLVGSADVPVSTRVCVCVCVCVCAYVCVCLKTQMYARISQAQIKRLHWNEESHTHEKSRTHRHC